MTDFNDLAVMHWGTYHIRTLNGKLTEVRPVAWDRRPSAIGQSLTESVAGPSRIRRPAVRAGFLRDGHRSREGRGREPFVEVSWEQATALVAGELARVKAGWGNSAIFGGSYGWASAGRFHHSQSQLHRFLNGFGGYTASRDTYSSAAAERLLPHILGDMDTLQREHTDWAVLAQHCRLFVAFGGLPTRNAQVNGGGANDHAVGYWLDKMRRNGTRFINISPVKNDLAAVDDAQWLALRPGSDTALLLALCYVLIAEQRYDAAFVASHTVGFSRFSAYVTGQEDGQPKSPDWAASITGLGAADILLLAREMAGQPTMINMSWSVQRAVQGEQAYWALVSLTALLGQIGTPGGGIGFGYSCTNLAGAGRAKFSGPRLPVGVNPVPDFIPVARLGDMLLHPGRAFDYDGKGYRYPDIRLVYWAGGNAFHHHQDLNRLVRAWRRPETVVVHEQYWTAQAKFADIVLPATVSLERDDIGSAGNDGFIIAMRQQLPPVAEARDDYAIFSDVARKLGFGAGFTEGRDTRQWLRHIYDESRPRAAQEGIELPSFDQLWQWGKLEYSLPAGPRILLEEFRRDPARWPLQTPSGKIELYCERIAAFGYDECPGHAVWQPRGEWLGSPQASRFPLHLLSSQPRTRLHSQYDHGLVSRKTKIDGREPIYINTLDATSRGIRSGQVVRVFNARGALLAGALVSDNLLPGVVQMATGAWYDPENPREEGSLDKHGNPNVLTADTGSSRLGQGCSAQSTLVEIEPWSGEIPPITAFDPPPFVMAGE